MHHRAAGEVESFDARVGIPAAVHHAIDAPDHVALREIHDQHPQGHEYENGREFHAFGNGTDNERRRDDGEHHLEHGEDIFRNPVGIIRVRRGSDIRHHPTDFRTANDAFDQVFLVCRAGAAKDHAVTADDIKDGHQAGDQEALSEHGQDVLLADETAVEQRQTGQRHEQHQRGAGHQPAIVAGSGISGVATDAVHQTRVDDRVRHHNVAVGVLQRSGRVAVLEVGFNRSNALVQ